MSSSFNLVKKPKKEDEEYEEEEENVEIDDDKPVKKSSDDAARKRLFLLMGIIVCGVLFLLFILWIASLFTTKNYSYEDMEGILKDAAISYFADYPQSLPQNEGDIVEIDASNLVVAGKMKNLSEYRNDGVVCGGSVQVQKAGSEYLYTPFLNCGDYYYSVEFYNKIVEDNPVTTSGEGLYSYNNHYVFRGETVNNYVQLDNSLWRIVKITGDSQLVLVHATGITLAQPWDNRYNEERLYESGINNYTVSRIKDYLEKVYKDPSKEDEEVILSNRDKTRMNNFDLCIGKRSPSGESKNNSEECKVKDKNQKMGLLTVSEYLYASLDPNCKSVETKSCMNYNYLSIDDEWWLATANSEDTSTVYKIAKYGAVEADIAGNYATVRPVIYLKSSVLFKSGKGTFEKPYKVK